MIKKIGHFQVFENRKGDISILDTHASNVVCFDECMAEKICKAIIAVAKEMRDSQNENE